LKIGWEESLGINLVYTPGYGVHPPAFINPHLCVLMRISEKRNRHRLNGSSDMHCQPDPQCESG
ncbi:MULTISPECIES: hypothetical protein, partial [unclassified Pantoea]|uniref:hypothetical protein n=1 Tax=unclassified Pantoea TaxID=2630326 RepID=UPI0023D97B5B